MRLIFRILVGTIACVAALPASAVEGRVFMASRAGEALPVEGAVIRVYDATAFRKMIAHAGSDRKKYEKLGARLSTLFEEAGEIPQQSVTEDERTRLLERNSTDTRKTTGEIESYAFRYLATLPLKPVAETRSDAEGRYILKIPDVTKVVIVASAERQLGTTLEHPCWIIFSPPPELNFSPANRTKKMPWELAP
ncbi:MAG TPA: hypothetical protein VHD32_16715 [Candidatus Didemnitutus sp.]|nr:hypothetical protein [Candidatus Didemnitutus sp.]